MDNNAVETNLQVFVRALYEAHDASIRVDNFDLHGDDEASMQKWTGLVEEQRAAFRTLHEICHRIPEKDLSL